MLKEIELRGKKIQYSLTYKSVKNINLRIKPDGTVWISANKYVPLKTVEEFLNSKEKLILNAIEKFQNVVPAEQNFDENEIEPVILGICEKVYPYYRERGIKYPTIKFRKMVSRWGSCHPGKRVLTFNKNLMYARRECIEYVVHHEFTHFLVPNHSQKFYFELSKVFPEWKSARKELKKLI